MDLNVDLISKWTLLDPYRFNRVHFLNRAVIRSTNRAHLLPLCPNGLEGIYVVKVYKIKTPPLGVRSSPLGTDVLAPYCTCAPLLPQQKRTYRYILS